MSAVSTNAPDAIGRPAVAAPLAGRPTFGIWSDRYVIAALVATLAIYLFGLDRAPLWLDEVDTANWSMLTPEQVWQTVFERKEFGRYDTRHLPLYFLIVKLWTSIAGHSSWQLRFPSVVFGLTAVAATAAFVDRIGGLRVARTAAWLAALSPFMLHHSQEARMYAAVGAFAAISLLFLMRYLDGADRRLGAGFVVINAAMLATHYYVVFLIAAEFALLAIFRRNQWREWLPAATVTAVLAGVLVSIAIVVTSQSSGEIYPLSWTALPGIAWAMIGGYVFLPSAEEMHANAGTAIRSYLPLAAAMGIPIAYVLWTGAKALPSRGRILVGVCLAGIFAGPFLVQLLFPRISLNPRYFMTGAPVVFALLAAGFPRYSSGAIHKAAAATIVLLMLAGTAMHLKNPGEKREDIAAVGRWLDARIPVDRPILITSDEMLTLALYHWPAREFRPYPRSGRVADAIDASSLARAFPFDGRHEAYFMVGRAWTTDAKGELRKALVNTYRRCEGFTGRGVEVYCLLAPTDNVGSLGQTSTR